MVLAAVAVLGFLILTIVRARAAEAVHGAAIITDGDSGIDAPGKPCLFSCGSTQNPSAALSMFSFNFSEET